MIVLPTTAPNQIIPVPVGVTSGTLGVSHTGCTYRGTDRDTCVIRFTEHPGNAGVYFTLPDSVPLESLTFENCTLEVASPDILTVIVQASHWACRRLVFRNVLFKGNGKNTIGFVVSAGVTGTDVTWEMTDVEFAGDGRAALLSGGIGHIDGVTIHGGFGGFTVDASGPPCTITGTDFSGPSRSYWQGPVGEYITVTGVDAFGCDVVSNVVEDRSLYDTVQLLVYSGACILVDGQPSVDCEKYDRLETVSGVWAEVDGEGQVYRWHKSNSRIPAEWPEDGTTVTILRPVIGRLFPPPVTNWSPTRLSLVTGTGNIPEGAAWRRPNGDVLVPHPALIYRAGIMRVASSPVDPSKRDVDTGGIAFNTPCVDCSVVGGEWSGWWSDQITDRGDGTAFVGLKVSGGQDMGLTLTGTNTFVAYCDSSENGVLGFCLLRDGRVGPYTPSATLVCCSGSGNNRHGYTGDQYTDVGIGSDAKYVIDDFVGSISEN